VICVYNGELKHLKLRNLYYRSNEFSNVNILMDA
jgi:hypothetical protein